MDNDVGKSQFAPTCPQDFDKDIASLNIQNWETEMASRMGDFEALLGRADISVVIMEIVILNGWDLDLLIDYNPVKVKFPCLQVSYPGLIFLVFVSLLHRIGFRCK